VGCGDEGAAAAEPAVPGDDVDVVEGGGPAGGAAGEGDGADGGAVENELDPAGEGPGYRRVRDQHESLLRRGRREALVGDVDPGPFGEAAFARVARFDDSTGFAEGAVQPVAMAVGRGHAVVAQVLAAQALHRDTGGRADGDELAVFAAGAGAHAADCRVSPHVPC